MTTIWLKPGRDGPSRRRHPWVYSGAILRVDGEPSSGETVRVVDAQGTFIATGHFSPASKIRVRLLEWEEARTLDEEWWRMKLARAIGLRTGGRERIDATAYRLVHAEADRVPGLIVDFYNGAVVMQSLTAGIEREKEMIADCLEQLLHPEMIYERSDVPVREQEGLRPVSGPLRGAEPADMIEVTEASSRFLVDIKQGQKTGFYLDQRDNRAMVASLAADRSVLDCFAYTGAFTVHALRHGASAATLIDSSKGALERARRNLALNKLEDRPVECIAGNTAAVLRSFRDSRRSFDLIILDPPKFARSRGQVEKAMRAYKDINLLAMKLLSPGGVLATFSCSGSIGLEQFTEIVGWAALDSGREVQFIQRMGQGIDHPVVPSFPPSEYLKGILCRMTDGCAGTA